MAQSDGSIASPGPGTRAAQLPTGVGTPDRVDPDPPPLSLTAVHQAVTTESEMLPVVAEGKEARG